MDNILNLSIGIGLVISLLFSELLGIAAGGMIVPGYIAMYMNHPLSVVLTVFVSYLTYFTVHSLSAVMIIYGRRRTVLMILTGFVMGWFIRMLGVQLHLSDKLDLQIIGYIIPGLIAIWMDRQGILETVTALITSSVIVRLVLILVFGRGVNI